MTLKPELMDLTAGFALFGLSLWLILHPGQASSHWAFLAGAPLLLWIGLRNFFAAGSRIEEPDGP